MTDQPSTPRTPENYGMLPYGVPAPPPEEREHVDEGPPQRPGSVTAAAVITWVFSGLALVVAAWMLVAVNVDRAAFEREVARQNDLEALGITASELARIFTVGGSVLAVLSLLAIGLAYGVFRKSNLARILLMILSLVTCVASLIVAFAMLPLAWLVAGLAVLSLLMVGRTKWWTHLPS
ncbi:MAG: hypothetical protein ABWX84_13125 [Nocardioides sp.]